MKGVRRAPDTSLAAAEIQARIFGAMQPADRVKLACQMSEEARQLAAEGARGRRAEREQSSTSDERPLTLHR